MDRSPCCRILVGFLLFSLIFITAPEAGTQSPAPAQSILFILDASGSMWGPMEGRTKIEIARDVLEQVLSNLPPNQPAGLMAYGHRRKGDCEDIETLLSVGAGQNERLVQTVRRIQPRGMTPISEALQQGAESLGFQENPASIVLVSDGVETCKGDPCAVAKRLHQAGVDLKVYVVGFDVSGKEASQLQCIADETGGRYFTARSVQALTQALAAIQAHVTMQEPLPEPEPVKAPPTAPTIDTKSAGTTRIKVTGVATIRLQPAAWVRMPPKYWKIVDAETGDEMGYGKGDTVRVTPGTYQFVWRQVEHGALEVALNTTVVAESGQVTTVPLDTGIRLTGPEGLGHAYYWQLRDEMNQTVAHFWGEETFLPQLVPAGRYRLIWRLAEHETGEADLGEVEIVPGTLLDKVLDTGFVLTLPDWLDRPYAVVLRDKEGGRYDFNRPGVHPLKPGEYTLIWRQTEHHHSAVSLGSVVIQPGTYTTLPVDAGLTILAPNQEPPYLMTATNLATGEKAEMRETWGPMPLPPGTYSLEMQETQHGGTPIRLVDELRIEAGRLVEIEF